MEGLAWRGVIAEGLWRIVGPLRWVPSVGRHLWGAIDGLPFVGCHLWGAIPAKVVRLNRFH